MCIALPAQVVAVSGDATTAVVEHAGGQTEASLVTLGPEATAVEPGTWLLVMAGLAVAVLDPADASMTNALLGLASQGGGVASAARGHAVARPMT